jgi:hypothetical protein
MRWNDPIRGAWALPAVMLCGSAAWGQHAPAIADAAPPSTFLVVSVQDCAAAVASLSRSDLGKLWREPRVREFLTHLGEGPLGDYERRLKDINAKPENVPTPTGAAGLAMFMPADWAATTTSEPPMPHVLILADFGPGIEAWDDLLDRLIDRAVNDKSIERRQDTYAGVTIVSIKPVPSAEKTRDDDEYTPPDGPLSVFTSGLDVDRELFQSRVGGVWLASTEETALESAIDVLQGKARPCLAETDVYRRSLMQHPGGAEVFVGVFLTPLGDVFGRTFGSEMPLPFGDPRAVFGALGFTDFEALTMGVHLEPAGAIIEESVGALMPRKQGLVALLADAGGTPLTPPTFVGPDVTNLYHVRFKFDGVIDVVRGVVATLPEELRTQATPGINEFAALMNPVFAQLGPDVYITQSLRRPLDAKSEQTLLAIQVRDPLVVANTITFLAGQAGGMLTPREFQGNTIHSSEELGVAIGQGFGFVFIGPPTAVENAMRSAGAPDGPALSKEAPFLRAAATLSKESLVSTYADVYQTVEWMYWQLQNLEKMQEAMFGDFEGWTPEEKADFLKSIRDTKPKWVDRLPGLEVLAPYLGASVGDLRATPDGFQGRAVLLRRE